MEELAKTPEGLRRIQAASDRIDRTVHELSKDAATGSGEGGEKKIEIAVPETPPAFVPIPEGEQAPMTFDDAHMPVPTVEPDVESRLMDMHEAATTLEWILT